MGCLGESYLSQVPTGEMEFTVSHYAVAGSWNWGRLHSLLPMDICAKISMLRPPLSGSADFPCWGLTGDGQFTLKSTYWVTTNEDVV